MLAATAPAPEAGLYALLLFTIMDPVCRRVAPLPPRSTVASKAPPPSM
ncbi:MAG: hypothetical protein GY895_19175 [Phycisphaera sp.]|nr:hypothetical protein [Phycisphaera sp.]